MTIDRREFLTAVTASATLAATQSMPAVAAPQTGPVFVNTWSDSYKHLHIAGEVFKHTGSLLDAVEKMINAVEDDPDIRTVGYGGLPNAEGTVELDAAIMDGTKMRAGSIVNLHKIKNPISVARLLMERTHHTTMAGAGALEFAVEMGFEPTQLLTAESLAAWEKWRDDPHHSTYWLPGYAPQRHTHDTVGLLGCDGKGHVVSGCSTSGVSFKLPGRVADSPIVGCGVYADDRVGAASATGDGDIMTNYCTSFRIITLMERGMSPQEACEETVRHMGQSDPRALQAQAAVIALSNRGEVGAAVMRADSKFQYGVWRNGSTTLIDAKVVFT